MEKMYVKSENILVHWMNKLFPPTKRGCINFGYWDNIKHPLTTKKRILSQKKLYLKVISCFDEPCMNLLEVGCGRGHGINWLHQKGYESYGIDILKDQIEISKNNYPNLADYFRVGKAESIPFDNSSFEGIYSIEAAQHFSSFELFCGEAYRVLKDSGILLISTYFLKNKNSKQALNKIIPDNFEGFHNALVIEDAINILKSNGFSVAQEPESIGKQVFPLYSHWQKQQLGNTPYSLLSKKQRKWKEYYTGGGKDDHPWLLSFKDNLLDYFIIKAYKRKND